MANETRMNKYKEFRDSFKDDEQPIKQVVDDSVGEDDFLSGVLQLERSRIQFLLFFS